MNFYKIGEEIFELELKKKEDSCSLHINGREVAAELAFENVNGDALAMRLGNSVLPAFVHREENEFYCYVGGETYRISAFDPVADAASGAHAFDSADKTLIAPMPGKVVKMFVKAGDEVKRGTRLMVIESMKMETEIVAPSDGKVKKIVYGEGDPFGEGESLIEIV